MFFKSADYSMDLLLVEDDLMVAELLTEIMSDEGYKVVHVSDAETAIEMTNAWTPRIVITDVNLGSGMTGFAVADHMHETCPDAPVLVISGVETQFNGRKRRPNERFLRKPFPTELLIRHVAEMTI